MWRLWLHVRNKAGDVRSNVRGWQTKNFFKMFVSEFQRDCLQLVSSIWFHRLASQYLWRCYHTVLHKVTIGERPTRFRYHKWNVIANFTWPLGKNLLLLVQWTTQWLNFGCSFFTNNTLEILVLWFVNFMFDIFATATVEWHNRQMTLPCC